MPSMTAWSTFTDGTVVHQAALNNLSTNGDTLCQITTGKTSASGVSSKPICEAHLTGTQSIAASTDTLISWNASAYNTDNLWTASQPTQFTVQTAGKYRISVVTDWTANATGMRSTKVLVNGTANSNAVASFVGSASNTFDTCYTVEYTVQLAVGAVIYFDTFQNSGGAVTVGTAFGGTSAVVEWVAP